MFGASLLFTKFVVGEVAVDTIALFLFSLTMGVGSCFTGVGTFSKGLAGSGLGNDFGLGLLVLSFTSGFISSAIIGSSACFSSVFLDAFPASFLATAFTGGATTFLGAGATAFAGTFATGLAGAGLALTGAGLATAFLAAGLAATLTGAGLAAAFFTIGLATGFLGADLATTVFF
jgi:hypothetical protein